MSDVNTSSQREHQRVTQRLGGYLAASRWHDIPAAARHEAKRTLLHWIGCAIGGSTHDTVERAVSAQLALSNHGTARLFGRKERLGAAAAAFINGVSSHVLDFDDTQLGPTNVHPTGPVASALFALAELQSLSGASLLHALVLGIEIECRLANSVFAMGNRGWHVTGAVGSIGAAAACSKSLGLDERHTTWALGTAATQVVGLREMFGSMCKSLHTGRAAENGLTAAMLAAEGFTSSDTAIEGANGYAQVLNGPVNIDGIAHDVGTGYEITKLSYKPYACGIVLHPTIEACLELHRENKDIGSELVSASLRVHPDVLSATGKKTPVTGLESKFSVYHAAAVALLHGIAGEEAFSDALASDPGICALRSCVSVNADPSVSKDEVFATFRLPDRTIDRHIEHVTGSIARPMTDGDLECKFKLLAEEALGASRCDRLIDLCWHSERLGNVGEILAAGIS